MERMGWRLWIACIALLSILLAGMPAAGYAQPASRLTSANDTVEQMISHMTVEERVGQLFLVTFMGNQAPPDSDIAELIQTYRVGGVALLASNGNIVNRGDAPRQTAELVNQLQQLSLGAPPLESKYPPLPPASVVTPTQPITPTGEVHVPLFIAVDHEGDGYPYTRLRSGFTPVPSNMAIGATWSPALAEAVGTIVGAELRAVGINMLLGPSLDVLDTPRPGGRGDMGIRTFGGDPYWVGALGEAYIRGVHLGSAGGVLTAAKHFPGNGGSDRRPDEEISTVNKSLKELYRIELAPFFAVTKESKRGSPSVTDALMTSHIRYRGFQGNIRQLTRPISFDAQNLPALMQLPEFAPWRDAGGLLVSDALGVPAVRKYYDPQLQTFPYRQIAQEAFLAGNDLLTLSQFALHDDWAEQFENIKATITFFQEKYVSDTNFRARVDDSLRRILALKLRLYPYFSPEDVLVTPDAVQDVAGKGLSVVDDVAKQALTLIYPGLGELADRLPSPPLSDEPIVIFTDVRQVSDCSDPALCPPLTLLEVDDFESQILKLYGPAGTGQVRPDLITSFSFADLWAYLHPEAGESGPPSRKAIEEALTKAQWVVFIMLDIDPSHYPASAALRDFLREGETLLRNKNVIVFAMAEPYYLDTTEISKLTAYYGLYSKMPPFIEVAVRTLFQEITPRGASPVPITGINYDLISITEPDPDQIIQVRLPTPAGSDPAKSVDITVGSTLSLVAGPILDHNGHPVPDGTPVEFRLFYPAEALELPRLRTTTVNGLAEGSVVLERVGQLDVTASSGNASRSTTLQVVISSNEPAQISTVVPSPTATFTPTNTPPPSPTPRPTATPVPQVTPTEEPAGGETSGGSAASRRWGALGLSLLAMFALGGAAGLVWALLCHSPLVGARLALWLLIGGLTGYVLYMQGLLPAGGLREEFTPWVAPLISVLCGLAAAGIYAAVERRRRPSSR